MTRTRLAVWLVSLLVGLQVESVVRGQDILLEAENFQVSSGWRVVRGFEGYFSGQPNIWSGNRLKAEDEIIGRPALARKQINVPESGIYNLWVRYESAYGFNHIFDVEILQDRETKLSTEFGCRDVPKYFPYDRGWQVQGPWYWHNTDPVYQKATVRLEAGPAEIRLMAGENPTPAAGRVLDLLFLTTDLELEPKSDYRWPRNDETGPPIIGRFRSPVWFKVKVPSGAAEPALVRFQSRFWLVGYYRGPWPMYYFTPDGLVAETPPEDAHLAPGSETPWFRVEFPSVYPALIFADSNEDVKLLISRDPTSRERPVAFQLEATTEEPRRGDSLPSRPPYYTGFKQIMVCTGHDTYGAPILRGRPAADIAEYLARVTSELESAPVIPGRRPRRLELSSFNSRVADFDMRPLATALGLTIGLPDASIYGTEGEAFGFMQDRIHTGQSNNHLTQEGYGGDFTRLRERYENLRDRLQGEFGDLPLVIKMVEETGTPLPTVLRNWEGMHGQFRDYLRERGVRPETVLPRETLTDLLAAGTLPSEEELWTAVMLGEGTPEEAVACPPLFYHTQYFRAVLFARTNADATRLADEVFPPGTVTHSGSILFSTGSEPSFELGFDPFLLFRERGFTAFSSEISWKLNTPDYVGAQVQSYEGALARALARYHEIPLYSYLISDRHRGYTPDFIELAAYSLASGGFQGWIYYALTYPQGCNILGFPENLQAIRRANYTLGVVEDDLLDSEALPSKVALGWLATTDVWDLIKPKPADRWSAPGNIIYPSERTYLYLLLRHLQTSVELLGEDDLIAGRLADYDVYFLVGDHLRPEAAEAIKDWVAAGGRLVSVAGGGLRDHYNRPLETLNEVFGIESARLEKKAEALRPKLELLHTLPLDEIALGMGGLTMPAYGYRQIFTTADGADVLGRFRNGEAAVVANRYGKGSALIIGALPGHAYLAGAFPLKPFGRAGEDLTMYIYPDYDSGVRDAVSALLSEVLPETLATADHPLVEVQVLHNHENGKHYLALVNYSGTKIENLKISIDTELLPDIVGGDSPYSKVSAARRGRFIDLTMQIDKFNFITLKE